VLDKSPLLGPGGFICREAYATDRVWAISEGESRLEIGGRRAEHIIVVKGSRICHSKICFFVIKLFLSNSRSSKNSES